MRREQNEALGSERPEWCDTIDEFMVYVETGLVDAPQLRREMQQLYLGLLVAGEITDFGELQIYLHEKRAVFQLSAKPFDPQTTPALACVDPNNGSPKQYAVEICQGSEIQQLLTHPLASGDTPLSHDVLEMILRHDTGIVVPGMRVKLTTPLHP